MTIALTIVAIYLIIIGLVGIFGGNLNITP